MKLMLQQLKPQLKWAKNEPDGDGTAAFYNVTGVFDTKLSESYMVICVQNVACKLLFSFY